MQQQTLPSSPISMTKLWSASFRCLFFITHNQPMDLLCILYFLSCFVGWWGSPSQSLCQVWSGLMMQVTCSLNLFKFYFSFIHSLYFLFTCFNFFKCLLHPHLGPKSHQLLSPQQRNLPRWWGKFLLLTMMRMMIHLVEAAAWYHPFITLPVVLPPQFIIWASAVQWTACCSMACR